MIKKLSLAAVGSFSTFLYESLTTIILTEFLGVPHRISYAVALVTGLILLFTYYKHIVFQVRGKEIMRFPKFIATYVTSYIVNWALVAIISMFIHYMIAIVVISLLLFPLNYYVNDIWVFTKNSRRE